MMLIELFCLICILSTGLADVQCPDKKSVCPDETTCCMLKSGQYGCCPMPNAVCCSDKEHCCPEGTTCDLQQETCVSSTFGVVPVSSMFLSHVLQATDVQCDNTGSVTCPDGTTCCKMEGGDWGCCPLPKAVCCQDRVHCCPENTVCDTQHQKCNPKIFHKKKRVPWSTKFPAKSLTSQLKDVQCDPDFSCDDNETCCRLESGDWGCCPFPSAVCCTDKIHCCPQDTTCNLQQGTCDQRNNGMDRTAHLSLTYAKNLKLSDLQCPDPSKTCGDSDTCCKQGSPPSWGCCPLPHAVCCADNVHCCPTGTKCNNESVCVNELNERRQGALLSAAVILSCVEYRKSFRLAQTKCKDVLLSVGRFTVGDKKNSVPMLLPVPNDITCPDHRSVCQGNEVTCCLMEDDFYGCCPFVNAVCCLNRKFCCPQNTTCSLLKKDICTSPGGVNVASVPIRNIESSPLPLDIGLPLFKMSTNGEIPDAKWSTCQNGGTKCLDSTTCCQNSEGNYQCCPHKEGQCCSNGQHCCPKGTTCDSTQSKCTSDNGYSFVWSSLIRNEENEQTAMCADSLHSCKMGGKCCKNMFGSYSCCPDPQGECCSNGLHCCPKGYLCGGEPGTCIAISRDGSN